MQRRAVSWRWLAVVAGATLTVGCTDYEQPSTVTNTTTVTSAAPVALPSERQTPFCQRVIDLNGRLLLPASDPAALTNDELITELTALKPLVPPLIAADFDLVIAQLDGTAPSTSLASVESLPPATSSVAPESTAPEASATEADDGDVGVDERATGPSDSPVERYHAYVDARCKSIASNPGPAATVPD